MPRDEPLPARPTTAKGLMAKMSEGVVMAAMESVLKVYSVVVRVRIVCCRPILDPTEIAHAKALFGADAGD